MRIMTSSPAAKSQDLLCTTQTAVVVDLETLCGTSCEERESTCHDARAIFRTDLSSNIARPGGEDEEERPSAFRGTGMTLGGDDVASRAIPDPSADTAQSLPRVRRVLHMWTNGFSVDDGPLNRFDDPANHRVMEMISQGTAPLALLGVEPGQPVDVELEAHLEEEYKPPKKNTAPFSGAGQRLGSPTPGAAPAAPSAPRPATAEPSTSTGEGAAATPSPEIDQSAPVVQLQIRLGDGTRLRARFNTTHPRRCLRFCPSSPPREPAAGVDAHDDIPQPGADGEGRGAGRYGGAEAGRGGGAEVDVSEARAQLA